MASITYLELDAEVVNKYSKMRAEIERAENPYEKLYALAGFTEFLDGQRPPLEREFEWSAEMNAMRKSLGELLIDITEEISGSAERAREILRGL